jgi:hypothetical protein
MAKSQQKKTEETQTSEGVPVRTWDSRTRHYEDGVPVLIDAPAQSAGSDSGQSAGNKEK